MQTITVHASTTYDILVGPGIITSAGAEVKARFPKARRIFLVSDSHVDVLYADTVAASLAAAGYTVDRFVFPAGETSKTFATVGQMVDRMAQLSMTRTDLLVALGGGVTGDMGGFAAAIYLRGIDFVQIPTSLLADVDSSIGGKTAVDLPSGKNLAGAFHQPGLVIIDTDTLKTLPDAEFTSGMGEVIKHGVLADPELFEILEKENARDIADRIIPMNLVIKRHHVEADEFDTGLRQLLNLGHTLAHAVEPLSGYEISHGNAVAIGLVAICRAAEKKGLCEEPMAERVEALCKKYGLMTECPYTAHEAVSILLKDKKRTGGTITLAMPRKIGECYRYAMPVEEIEAFYEAVIG